MSYEHRQSGGVAWLFIPMTIALCGLAVWFRADPQLWLPLLAGTGLFLAISVCFASLTVRDEGDALLIAFGPVPLFWRRVEYHRIESAEVSKSRWFDGLGIHWIPRRGWTYNLWGFSCVELRVDGRRMRIGTNDAPSLAAFLAERLNSNPDQARDVCASATP